MKSQPLGKKFWLVFALVAGAFLGSLFYYRTFDASVVGGGDPWGYYVYLPATFIYHDLDSLHRTVAVRKKYAPGSVAPHPTNPLGIGEAHPSRKPGKYVVKYTSGVALMEAPFFLLTHGVALATGWFSADGFAKPYVLAMHLAALFYALAGLLITYRALRRCLSEWVSLATIFVLALATNLYYFSVYSSPMAHAFLFFLYANVVLATMKWHEKPRLGQAVLLGLCCGMITLIRPTEIIVLALPVLFGLRRNHGDFKNHHDLNSNRLAFFWRHRRHIFWAAAAFAAVNLPQLIYWKWTSGSFIFYSYVGEGFDFLHSRIGSGMFGYKNGWLAYTPVMWLALAGILILCLRNLLPSEKNPLSPSGSNAWLAPLLVFLPLHIYLIYSWWCWNYINGFGSRPMVETYPLLAIPLGYFLTEAARRRWMLALAAAAVLFCTWLNLFNTWQFSKGMMWSEDGTKAFFWQMLGKTNMDYADLVAYDSGEWQPDTSRLRRLQALHFNDFENPADSTTSTERVFQGQRALHLTSKLKFGGQWSIAVGNLPNGQSAWLRVGAWANATAPAASLYQMSVLSCRFARGGKTLKARHIRIESKVANPTANIWSSAPGQWGEAFFWVKIPGGLRPTDELSVNVWNENGQPVFVDDLSVEVWTDL